MGRENRNRLGSSAEFRSSEVTLGMLQVKCIDLHVPNINSLVLSLKS